ncbi:MAG: hypothetical protein KDB63_21330 [Nocardioidaceae bacterium]|nr:hypothetical protein [Nocardioidaceae bacterium]
MQASREQFQRATELCAFADTGAPLAVVSAMTLLCDPMAVVDRYTWAMVSGHRSVWVVAWLTERHIAYLHAQSAGEWAAPDREPPESLESWIINRHAITELSVRQAGYADGSAGPVLRAQYALAVADHTLVLPPADLPGGRLRDAELDEAERFVRVAARNLVG